MRSRRQSKFWRECQKRTCARVLAAARQAFRPTDDYDLQLAALLPNVKTDETARAKYLEILDSMGFGSAILRIKKFRPNF